jgi:hypothetical protein
MIGSLVNITIQKKVGRGILHLGFPLWAVWLLLLPLAILMLPVVLVVCLVGLVDPFRVISVFWGILRALNGAEVEVDDHRRLVAISIH